MRIAKPLWVALVRETAATIDLCSKAEATGLYANGAFGAVLDRRLKGVVRAVDGTRATLVEAVQALDNLNTALQVAVEHGRKDVIRHEDLINARSNAQQAGRTAARQQRQARERMRQMRMGPVAAPSASGEAEGQTQGRREEGREGCKDATRLSLGQSRRG